MSDTMGNDARSKRRAGRRSPVLALAGSAVALVASLAVAAPATSGGHVAQLVPAGATAAPAPLDWPCGNGETKAFTTLCAEPL